MVEGMRQIYADYTDEDQFVWKTLYERQMAQLDRMADSAFLSAVEEIGFNQRIPDFNSVNTKLANKTGWQIRVVPGIIQEADFFELLANKEFPSSTWLRSIEELDYLSEPDMFHDGFGHMPLLTNQTFCNFFEHIGRLGVTYSDVPEILTYLGRIYWFTVEFGLIHRVDEDLRIYGAGILSSFGESKYSLSNQPEKRAYHIYEVMNTDFDNTVIQELYYVIASFEEIEQSLVEIEPYIEERAMEHRKRSIA